MMITFIRLYFSKRKQIKNSHFDLLLITVVPLISTVRQISAPAPLIHTYQNECRPLLSAAPENAAFIKHLSII